MIPSDASGVQSGSAPVLGVDFDNTIVSYDRAFHRAALDRRLVPADLPPTKQHVRDYLRQCGQEAAWTELQGEVYGARMSDAEAFPRALDVLRRCRQAGVRVLIISHKTRYPYAGQQYDLHAAALEWLHAGQVLHPAGVGLTRDDVFFEATKTSKIARIVANRCTHFVDDLPEFLADEAFPPSVNRILFDPHAAHHTNTDHRVAMAAPPWRVAAHWDQVEELVRGVPSPAAR